MANLDFQEDVYLEEMGRLLRDARDRLTNDLPDAEVYTVSVWTDPDAAVSVVSVDTLENSAAKTRGQAEWDADQYRTLVSEGDLEMAALFLPEPTRITNPADYLIPHLVRIRHMSFPRSWGSLTGGGCWEVLEPALRAVGRMALQVLHPIRSHPDCRISVNGRSDWYLSSWPLKGDGCQAGE